VPPRFFKWVLASTFFWLDASFSSFPSNIYFLFEVGKNVTLPECATLRKHLREAIVSATFIYPSKTFYPILVFPLSRFHISESL
jgi:hypothetical protein